MNKIYIRKRPLIVIALVSLFLLVAWIQNSSNFSKKPPTIQIVQSDYNNIEDPGNAGGGGGAEEPVNLACQHPELPLHNPDIDKFFEDVPPLECDKDGEDWMTTFRSTAYVTETAKELYGPIKCHVTELLRQDEYQTVNGRTVTIDDSQVYVFATTDYVEVNCDGKGGRSWKSYLAAPRQGLEARPVNTAIGGHGSLNVLIWGQDSVSRLMFMRKLPKTFKYLEEELGAIVLKGYNILGDGTPQALIPMLTGQTELELPEARAEMGDKAQHVDVYPFIWKEYKEQGYLTGYMEDQPTTGTFSHRHKGFDQQPTDFYTRTFFLAVDSFLYPVLTKVFSYIWPNFCIANKPTHEVIMDYIRNIFLTYPKVPKFLFTFRSEPSHNDINAIQAIDGDFKKFLESLNAMGIYNNTIVILMSDHGARFQSIRESQQGKTEERLPAFMFIFPQWFSRLYPTAHGNFLKNSKRLVTAFDIHRTLRDIYSLGLDLKDEDFREPNKLTERGMSLFREVPSQRTCKDADIEPHWCACLKEEKLAVDNDLVKRAAQEFVRMLNSLTESHRSICTPLELGSILSAIRLIPSEELLKFRNSADKDGRVPSMRDNTAISNMIIQLKIETLPNRGHYEVTMNYDLYKSKFFVKKTDISRTNRYGSQADCVRHKPELSFLRMYCLCKESNSYR